MNGSRRGTGHDHARAGGPGQGYLRAAEREDFELRLGEIMGENKELRRQVAACKTQLAKMYEQIMIECGRKGRAGGGGVGGGGGGGSPQKRPDQQQFHRSTSERGENWEDGDAGIDQLGAQVEAAREREAAARRAWQRAKSPLPSRRHGSKGRRGRNSSSPGSPHTSGDERRSGSPRNRRDGASPKRSNAADEELLRMLRESEATTAALRSELLDRNASLVEALAEAKDLKLALVDLQVDPPAVTVWNQPTRSACGCMPRVSCRHWPASLHSCSSSMLNRVASISRGLLTEFVSSRQLFECVPTYVYVYVCTFCVHALARDGEFSSRHLNIVDLPENFTRRLALTTPKLGPERSLLN